VCVPVARLLDRHTVLAGSTLKGSEFAAQDTVKGKAQRPIQAKAGVEDHHEEIEALGCKPL